MSQPQNKKWVLNGQIVGTPTAENFTITETPYPELAEGEFLIKNEYFSPDPYLRGQFMNPATWNQVVQCYTSGTVIDSKNEKFPVGAIVTGVGPAQLYVASKDTNLRQVDKAKLGDLSLSTLVGSLGMPGATALGANQNTKPGDVVFINASCGVVGSLLGQMAKKAGAKLVIGSAGGPQKCALAVEKYGYDVCIDYKEFVGTDAEKSKKFAERVKQILAEHGSEGINVYYDLVGGFITDALLLHDLIVFQGKVIVIGAIDEYNSTNNVGPRLFFKLIYKAITVQGFIVFGCFGPQFPEFTKKLEDFVINGLNDGSLNSDETVIDGFDKISEAFIGLFTGKNIGKMVVKA